MSRKQITFFLLSVFYIIACHKTQEQHNNDTTSKTNDGFDTSHIKTYVTNDEGKKLMMSFDKTNKNLTITFDGDTSELIDQKPASGMWYKNDIYELRGKGEELELTKNGTLVFKKASSNKTPNTDTLNDKSLSKDQIESKQNIWWLGKQFTNNKPISKNPEEGGADFLKINKDNTADFKVGDMVEKMTWEVKNTNIILKSTMSNRSIQFKIEQSNLKDEYGTKWYIQK